MDDPIARLEAGLKVKEGDTLKVSLVAKHGKGVVLDLSCYASGRAVGFAYALLASDLEDVLAAVIDKLRSEQSANQILRGSRAVLARWMSEALPTLEVAEAVLESEDGGEQSRLLISRGKDLVECVLAGKD